jgi:thiamine-phosphate pyrophosphorylase
MQFTLPPVYPITDKHLAASRDHFSIVRELVLGGAGLVQIRDKTTPAEELLDDIRRCVEFASGRGVSLILNDRCDLALSGRASGVHLGQGDLPPEAARALLGAETVIGFSTHSLAQVRKAQEFPVQYLGFGPVFGTTTKADASPAVGLKKLRKACRLSKIPVVAIGGIGLEHVCEVLEAGASSVAVISALMTAPDLAGQMRRFLDTAMGK